MRALILAVGAIAIAALIYFFTMEKETEQTEPITTAEDTSQVVPTIGLIDDERINNADSEPGNWLAYGRTYEEQRFSPLTQINRENVADLGLAWYRDMGTNRAQEATPIVVDGIMFFTSAWSRVFAMEATTGEIVWTYDPEVPGEVGRRACCDVVNRGVAVYKGRVYVGSLDGRLIALDAARGFALKELKHDHTKTPTPFFTP